MAHSTPIRCPPSRASRRLNFLLRRQSTKRAAVQGERLKVGLNEMLTKLEVQGCATGINSLIFLRLGVDADAADPDRNPNAAHDMRNSDDAEMQSQLNLAMLNHGVHAGNAHGGARFILSAAHTDGDIDTTVAAIGSALTDVREQGLL